VKSEGSERELEPKTENWEQRQLIQWARSIPELQYLFHIPNEAVGGKGWIIRNRQLGVKSGIPDLFLPIPARGYHGLFIEMKTKTGGRLSHEQKLWIDALNTFGYRAVVCHGWEEARIELEAYLNLKTLKLRYKDDVVYETDRYYEYNGKQYLHDDIQLGRIIAEIAVKNGIAQDDLIERLDAGQQRMDI